MTKVKILGKRVAEIVKIGKAKTHTDTVTLYTTVFLDDNKVVDNGNILV
ncbi:MAG TPA: hypothetical protein VMV84_06180 [Dehalococcoidales bacterium]|nr:hypothetical protein [Dehalococcoidales bacterium]